MADDFCMAHGEWPPCAGCVEPFLDRDALDGTGVAFARHYATVFHERESGDHLAALVSFRAGWMAARKSDD